MRTLRGMLRLVLTLTLAVIVAGATGAGSALAAQPGAGAADVVVTVRPGPQSAEGVAYTIVATNNGTEVAHNTTISVPFDSAALRVLGVQSEGSRAWVKSQPANTIEIQIDQLANGGESVAATVHFARLPGAPAGTGLTQRLTYHWGDGTISGAGRSNLPVANAQPAYALTVTPDAGLQTFKSGIFAPGEPVTLWYNTPTGVAKVTFDGAKLTTADDRVDDSISYIRADADGNISIDFSTAGLAPGAYSMVAHGNWTGFSAVGPFQVK